MKIKDLKIGDSLGDLHCFVAAVTERLTKKGDPFVQATLKDETGEFKANVWGTGAEEWEYNVNDVVCVTGTVGEYNGNASFDISSWRPSGQGINDFARQSERDIPEMFAQLLDRHISRLENPFIKFLAEELILAPKAAELFMAAPAAKGMHHPWIGGLLEHVLGLCNLAESVYHNHYKAYFPNLDLDKVKFGLIFHDWGKVLEYDFSTPNLGYTERGAFQHHIGIVCEQITRKSVVFESTLGEGLVPHHKTKVLPELLHIIYSHHGKIEWSALMPPATPEALFVHWLDNFDAQIMNMRESLQKGEGSTLPGWTDKNWAMELRTKLKTLLIRSCYERT